MKTILINTHGVLKIKSFICPSLDLYEQRVYSDLLRKGLAEKNALEVIINNVEGDYSQLSDGLLNYAVENKLITIE